MSLLAIQFNFSELRFRRATPFFLAAVTFLWLGTLFWPAFLLVPAFLALGFRACVWSAMSYEAFLNYGRRVSRKRLIEMIPGACKDGCPKAINLRNYLTIAPYFWTVYAAFIVVFGAQILR